MWFFNLLMSLTFADVGRLTSSQQDLSQISTIYLSPGLVSLLEFPNNIIEVRVGNPRSVKALISQVSPKELTVYLTGDVSAPCNLIVRAEKRVFVFDVVPSKSNHQDYIRIRGTFGTPDFVQTQVVSKRIEIKPQDSKKQPTAKGTKSKTLKVGP